MTDELIREGHLEAEVRRLREELGRARELLREVEWSGYAHTRDGELREACPVCFGVPPGDPKWLKPRVGEKGLSPGHEAGCGIGRVLKGCEGDG